MLTWIIFAFTIIVAYLLGSVNTSIVITKCMGSDIRNFGSGNAGATNMLRTYGKAAAIGALAGDLLKGVIAVWLAMYIEQLMLSVSLFSDPSFWLTVKYFAAVAVILGHNYPVFFGFKGGKGIGTSAAVILMLDWRVGLILLVISIGLMAVSKYVSLGSVVGGILYPILCGLFVYAIDKSGNHAAFIASIAIGVLAVYRHKSNILRLMNGTESKLGQKKQAS